MGKRIRTTPLLAAAAALAALTFGSITPVSADGGFSVSFFAGAVGPVANGSAHWTRADSSDSDPFSVAISVPEGVGAPNFFSSFGGIAFHRISATPPDQAPSFDFKSSVTGPSGGSPRLVMTFSDGGSANLRPLAWVANVWATEDGSTTDWDNNGGTCGFLYEVTYETVLACHAGETVTSAFIVSDSGWLYTSGYTNLIDKIQYGGTTISQPSDNSQS